jgi:glycosyltransferase involved in cell wall biosynthesis
VRPRVLFLSYDGLLEPLGQSQVLAYQERLAAIVDVDVMSFEKRRDWSDDGARSALARRLRAAGIRWHPRRYHKRPSAPATAYDIAVGIVSGLWIALRHRVRIVHARSYVPAVVALALRWMTGARFIFDMRGFWADERVDGGLWRSDSKIFRVAKWFERRFLLHADHVVSLTSAAAREIATFPYLQGRVPPISVIPTCADLGRFRPDERDRGERPFTLGFVGAAGTWNDFDATVTVFSELRRQVPSARLLVVNRDEHEYILQRLVAGGVPLDAAEVRSSAHGEIAALIGRMDAGVFFRRPAYSAVACAPTKLAEFLGCGVPCITTARVGDLAEILSSAEVGVALDELTPAKVSDAVSRIRQLAASPEIQARCRAAALRHFSLDVGVAKYAEIYRALAEARL